jgi:hypothetical protein
MAGAAHAHFPETKEVAKRLKGNYSELDSWQVNLELNGTSQHGIRCWRKGDLWRQEWVAPTENGTRVARAVVGRGQRIEAVSPASPSAPYPPLRLSWLKAPKEAWQRMSIRDGVKSYQFLEDRPCIVVGAKYGDLRSSQVWIDLERRVPLRLVAPSGITWRWSEYYSLGNHLLPTRLRIEFPQGRSFSFDLQWQQVATDVGRSQFTGSALREGVLRGDMPEMENQRMRFLWENLPRGYGAFMD